MKNKKFYTIQFLRFIAAMSVCITHLFQLNHTENLILLNILEQLAEFGVYLFFVISGFIIAWLLMKEQKLPSFKSALSFLIKRIFRIYSLYWVIIISVVLFDKFFFSFQPLINIKTLLLLTSNITLVPQAWTLSFELYFYLSIFCFMCFFQQKYFIIIASIVCSFYTFIFISICYNFFTYNNKFLYSGMFICFYLGIIICYYFTKNPNQNNKILLFSIFIAIGMLILSFIFKQQINYNFLYKFLYFSTLVCCIMYGVIGLEIKNQIQIPMFFIKLGDASYSIYLWHFLIHGLKVILIMHLPYLNNVNIYIQILFELFVIILWSLISYKYIETPAINIAHKTVKNLS